MMQKLRPYLATNLLLKTCKTTRRRNDQLIYFRCFSLSCEQLFKYTDLQIQKCDANQLSAKPDWKQLVFGRHFCDHMFEVKWKHETGWETPKICPVHNFSFHPSAKVFHYAQELFEGMKAFRGVDNKIRLFRPNLNMQRMLSSAQRIDLPVFDENELTLCLKQLVSLDSDWIPPHHTKASLYIRPTFIGTEAALGVISSKEALLYIISGPVGPYFSTGFKPVSLLADPNYIRAWPGGCGDKKLGSNYAPTLLAQKLAEKTGCQQVLWLFGDDHQLTEVGTMNIFVFIINDSGQKELITPPLHDGLILPGVTRISLIELARQWNEFQVTERNITMNEVKSLLKQNRLLEMFGAGTACVVCPVGRIKYMNEDLMIPTLDQKQPVTLRFYDTLSDIQYGKVEHEWAVPL